MAKKEVKSILHDVSEETPPSDPPTDVLRIDELTLLRMTRFMEKERAARMELQLASGTLNGLFQEWLRSNEQASKLNQRIIELQAEQKTSQEGYQKIVEKVAKELQVDMSLYSFDDETGVLHPLPDKPAKK